MSTPKLHCPCGEPIARPIPSRCPKCGAVIAGVRGSWLAILAPLAMVGAMLALLLTYLFWLLR